MPKAQDVDAGRSCQGLAGCSVGGPWPWRCKTGSHKPQQSKGATAALICAYPSKKKKKKKEVEKSY